VQLAKENEMTIALAQSTAPVVLDDGQTRKSVVAAHAANRTTLVQACEAGYTHCLRTPWGYFFFRSQSAMTKKIKKLGLTSETYPNGVMRYGNSDNLVWFI
jgi:hypothetical protein